MASYSVRRSRTEYDAISGETQIGLTYLSSKIQHLLFKTRSRFCFIQFVIQYAKLFDFNSTW